MLVFTNLIVAVKQCPFNTGITEADGFILKGLNVYIHTHTYTNPPRNTHAYIDIFSCVDSYINNYDGIIVGPVTNLVSLC